MIQEVIIANVVRARGEGQRDSMSSQVTGHPGPTGEQTLASEVVPTLWEVVAVIAQHQSGSGSIYRLQLSDGKSEEFLSFNYSFLSLSNTSSHTMKRKTKKQWKFNQCF